MHGGIGTLRPITTGIIVRPLSPDRFIQASLHEAI
jgi:hypothetical protein